MYWWQKSSVTDSPSHSLSFSDDIHSKSSIFGRRAWSFKSQDSRHTSRAKKLRPLGSFDVVNSLKPLPRSRSINGYSMAPQPLPLPERQEAVNPSNSTASMRLPSPPGSRGREEREKCDGPRRDGHASGDAFTLTSEISR